MKDSVLPHSLRLWLGIERNTTSHAEKCISALGGLLGIVAVYGMTHWAFDAGFIASPGGLAMLASMGATAVLLFAVPQGALSQPWAVLGGHLVSAFIGVSVEKVMPGHVLAPAIAVGLAVGAMHYLRCIHPPGGATALAAVIGNDAVHALGYGYLITPVGISVLSMLLMAVAFNGLFPWRRYPAHLHRRRQVSPIAEPGRRRFDLTQEDFSAAMEQLNSYVDITEENLTELLELAKQHAERNVVHPARIEAGRIYSNGRLGRAWSVREVLAVPDVTTGARRQEVVYRVSGGFDAGQSGSCPVDEFRQWAHTEVVLREGRWVRE
ncbi:MAG TPA: HPP family protein [Stenotrophomonas sp.]|jgi:CBS-domain-containing membrane protein